MIIYKYLKIVPTRVGICTPRKCSNFLPTVVVSLCPVFLTAVFGFIYFKFLIYIHTQTIFGFHTGMSAFSGIRPLMALKTS
jgi:hypothetical protein